MDRAVQLKKTVRDLDAIDKFLKCGGISQPPDTNSGKTIKRAMDELVAASGKKMPDIHKMLIAEMCVGSILIARASMTTIIHCRRPQASASALSQLKTAALREATRHYFQAVKSIMECLKMLAADVNEEDTPNFEKMMAGLRKDYVRNSDAIKPQEPIDPEWKEEET